MASEPTTTERQFGLEHIYVKRFKFTSPQSPEVFTTERDTRIDLNVRSDTRGIDAETVEVVLTLTLKSLDGDESLFELELEQAGLFKIRGFSPDDRFALLATQCPAELLPYARAVIATAANKGGFPDLFIQALDFHELHRQTMEQAVMSAPLN
jgi:preprotein translocase subunit SecB